MCQALRCVHLTVSIVCGYKEAMSVSIIEDIPYVESPHELQHMDVYQPNGTRNGRAILWIHGGGWHAGNRKQWSAPARHFAERGYVCASASYRLVPDFALPSMIQDVRQAMAFFRSKAGEYGFADDQIAAVGSSAGGHLVSLLATIAEGDELGVSSGLINRATRPNAVIAYCPVLDLAFSVNPRESIRDAVASLLRASESEIEEACRVASPSKRITGHEPPFLLIHGDKDKIVPLAQSSCMLGHLIRVGVPASLITMPGVGHGFGYGDATDPQKSALAYGESFLEMVFGARASLE
jgi:acetyl esterase/lipase